MISTLEREAGYCRVKATVDDSKLQLGDKWMCGCTVKPKYDFFRMNDRYVLQEVGLSILIVEAVVSFKGDSIVLETN